MPSTNALQFDRDTTTSDNASLTGRIPLWSELMVSVEQHPLLGQGFGAFWTPANIDRVSADQGWGISAAHSAYVDVLLALGAVGLVLYLDTLVLSLFLARRDYMQHPGVAPVYFGIMLLFAVVGRRHRF